MKFLQNISFKKALLFISFLLITVPLITQGLFSYYQSKKEVDKNAEAQISQQAQELSKHVKSVYDLSENQIKSALKAARMIALVGFQSGRKIETDNNEKEQLFAINQITKEGENIELPSLKINGEKQLFNTKIVDQIKSTMDCESTIFQIFPKGMVRISTTVLDEKGERAIGTYIP